MIGNPIANRIFLGIVAVATLHATLVGEPLEPQTSSTANEGAVAVPGDSLEKMISDRQNELAKQQETLSETIGNLGDNHPSVAALREEAEQMRRQLEFWSSPREELLNLSGREMRALVLQLVVRVDRLESEQRSLKSARPQSPQRFVPGVRPR